MAIYHTLSEVVEDAKKLDAEICLAQNFHESLPEGLLIEGALTIKDSAFVTALPRKLQVLEKLSLTRCPHLFSLPQDLYAYNLHLREMPIKEVSLFGVEGGLSIKNCPDVQTISGFTPILLQHLKVNNCPKLEGMGQSILVKDDCIFEGDLSSFQWPDQLIVHGTCQFLTTENTSVHITKEITIWDNLSIGPDTNIHFPPQTTVLGNVYLDTQTSPTIRKQLNAIKNAGGIHGTIYQT